jgi:hypothetical protein
MSSSLVWGIVALVSIVGGMILSVFILKIVMPQQHQERLLMLEAQNRERQALIEKGLDPSIVYKKEKAASGDPLFWGLLLVGIGLGAFVGDFMSKGQNDTAKNALACLFGGIGLIIYNKVRGTDPNKAQ